MSNILLEYLKFQTFNIKYPISLSSLLLSLLWSVFPVSGDVERGDAGGEMRKSCYKSYKSIPHLAFIMGEPLLSLRPSQKELDAHEMGADEDFLFLFFY